MSTDLIELIFIALYVFDHDSGESVWSEGPADEVIYECDSSNAGMLRY